MPEVIQIVLGLGPGQCGLNLLAEILAKQSSSEVTLEERPLLPWPRSESSLTGPDSLSPIRQRLNRWKFKRHGYLIGDVASFYLPYVEEVIEACPSIRIVCLERPIEEICAAFCRQLDQMFSVPTDHWSTVPALGWHHDPIWSQIYPKYDSYDRNTGLIRYCTEYYVRARSLQRQFPTHFQIVDTEILTTREGVRQVLSFLNIPEEKQVLVTGKKPSQLGTAPVHVTASLPRHKYPDPMDPRRCVVLVPYSGYIYPECDQSLKELERRGYQVRRVGGYAAIDQGRNQLSTDALIDGFEETLWIDSDVAFDPDDVEKLRRHSLPMVCGIYPQKGKRALACHVAIDTPKVVFGQQGGLIELLYAGTGFLHIRREVYMKVQSQLNLPICNERFGHPMIPFFLPMIRSIEDGNWYLAEDYSFCERARQCGYQIYADTSIRLWHIGMYRYGWEDAGIDRQRFNSFTLNFGDGVHGSSRRNGERISEIASFASRYPWPSHPPSVPPIPERDWLFPATKKMLAESLVRDADLIVEVGSWLGRSTRLLAGLAPNATVIAVDHWKGSPEHFHDPELAAFLPHLYDAFLSECWEYRDRIVPLRANSVDGLRMIAETGLRPNLIYIDADHAYEAVLADVTTALECFPSTSIVGDDWNWPGVKRAVEELVLLRRLRLEVQETAWRIIA